MGAKEILGLTTPMLSLGLVGENIAFVKNKAKSVVGFMGLGIKNILGTTLIKTQAQLVGSM